LGPSGLGNSAGIPGAAAGAAGNPFEGANSLLSGIMDGVNQIVQTAMQAGAPQPPGFGGGTGFDGGPGGPGDHPGAGAGQGHGSGAGAGNGSGAGAGAGGPGKMHLSAGGVPVAAANLSPLGHSVPSMPATDGTQPGAGGAGAPPGGGHGGGGQGGGKDHKGNKALRGDQNGVDLIGQPDAVVAVIGDDGSDSGPGWSTDS
jgi:hypothetical protein